MRLIFAGTPVFASEALAALIAAGHEVALVLTRADKPAGRGQKIVPSPVKTLALEHGLRVYQPTTLRDEASRQVLAEVGADVMVVAAYGMILPQAILDLPARGCLNIHASLLPRWRGAAPIQRAIEAGDARTGITIMQMDAGLDTGPMLLDESMAIEADDNAARLHDRLAALGATLIVRALSRMAAGDLPAVPQPQAGVTYAHKILKSESPIDWTASARQIVDRIRAFDPFPGCTGSLCAGGGEPDQPPAPVEQLKIWRAMLSDGAAPAGAAPGSLLTGPAGGLRVVCGDGVIELLEVQRAGGRRLAVTDWLRAAPLASGARFELVAKP